MRHSGFTLIELVVTLAVVGILVVLATPSFNDFFEKSRLRGATDDLVTLLNTARAEAVKLDRDVNVSLGGTTTAWCAGANAALDPAAPAEPVPAVAKCDCTSSAACLVEGQRMVVDSSRYDGITVSNVADNATFDSKLGTLDPIPAPGTTPLSLTITSKTGKYQTQLSLSPLGQISVCLPAGKPFISGYPSC